MAIHSVRKFTTGVLFLWFAGAMIHYATWAQTKPSPVPRGEAPSSGTSTTGGVRNAETGTVLPRVTDLWINGSRPAGSPVGAMRLYDRRRVDLRITLDRPAPAGGVQVQLSTANPAVIRHAASVLIPAGTNQGYTTLEFNAVSVEIETTLTAALGGTPVTRTLFVEPTIAPPVIESVTWPHEGRLRIAGRNLREATVELGPWRPVADLNEVHHVGDTELYWSIAADVPAGTFPLRVINPGGSAIYSLTVPNRGGTTAQAGAPQQLLATLSVTQQPVAANASVQLVVTLATPATGSGATVQLASSHPSVLPVPQSILVSAGTTGSRVFLRAGSTPTAVNVTITATLYGRSIQLPVTVGPAKLVLQPHQIAVRAIAGGTSAQAQVALNGPAEAKGAPVTLRSSSSVLRVPASVTILPGQVSAVFDVVTDRVKEPVDVTVTATCNEVSINLRYRVQP